MRKIRKLESVINQGKIIVFKDRIVRLWNPQTKQDRGESEVLFEDTCPKCGAKSPQYAEWCFGCKTPRPHRFGLNPHQIELIDDTHEAIKRNVPYQQILTERIKYATDSIEFTNKIIRETEDQLAKSQ